MASLLSSSVKRAPSSGYGSTDPERAGHEEADDKVRRWESRGSIFGIVIDVFASAGWHMGILLTMFYHMRKGDTQLLPCSREPPWSLSETGALICEYTEAYVCCFPAFSLTLVLFFVGREIMQKRLYYGLLKAGGVLGFGQNIPWRDPLIWVLFWCYAHVFMHLLFLLFAAIHLSEMEGSTKDAIQGGLSKLANPEGDPDVNHDVVYLLADLIGFMIIPSTLFLVFFYQAYDIEKTLVPLSQFVHDAQEVTNDVQSSQQELNGLLVFQDAIAKVVLEEYAKGGSVVGAGLDTQERYAEFLRLYAQEKQRHEAQLEAKPEAKKVYMMDGMWPLNFLLVQPHKGEVASLNFNWLWFAYCAFVVPIGLVVLLYLAVQVRRDILQILEENFQAVLGLVVKLLHLILVAVLLDRLITPSVRQTWFCSTWQTALEGWKRRFGTNDS